MQPHVPLLIIIDDEEDLLDLLEYNFSREGFRVAVFNRAQPALEYIRTRRPDLILCDWMMPEIDGLECCRRIRSDQATAQVPFVMVTCRTGQASVQQALAAGASAYIPKPIHMRELLGRVRHLLGQPQGGA
ncbi:MAG: hypothetical protein OHK0039_48450 [Bacteroidia bacterium]